MTVSTTPAHVAYAGNGSTVDFVFNYYFLAAGDLKVILRTTAGAEIPKYLTTDYTVAGAGLSSGGTVTMLVAPATGEELHILRDQSALQPVDLVANDSLPSATVETEFDRLTLLIGQILKGYGIERVMRMYDTDVTGTGRFNAQSNRVSNMDDGVDASDGATVGQLIGAGALPIPSGDVDDVLRGDATWGPPHGTLLTVFTASDPAWAKPADAVWFDIYAVGGGGGGGGGRKDTGAVSTKGGGGGGAGGSTSRARLMAADLGSTIAIVVGDGGTSGAAQTTTNNGGSGGAGGDSSFDTQVIARGGPAGAGGTTAGGAGGLSANGDIYGVNVESLAGGAGSSNGAGGDGEVLTATISAAMLPGGGGGGGGQVAGGSANVGGNASRFNGLPYSTLSDAYSGQTGTTAPDPGEAGGNIRGLSFGVGGGGGGGRSNSASDGTAGGAGAIPGGAGGGGGSTKDGTTSGAGGVGARGVVVVIAHY